ncbi:hypothetical protein CC80DRAFT_369754, partial [Byssothecium circinans]
SFLPTTPSINLPPELWSLIIEEIDDFCFVWFILRRVSHSLRVITENLVASHLIRTCSIRFSGPSVSDLI